MGALVFLPLKVVGAEGKSCGEIECDPFSAQLDNDASLQNGARLAVNYCMGCHSFKYSRWERVADDLNIPHELMLQNMVFSGQKIGELMTIAMSEENSKAWFGAVPPDLTLVARSRSPEWIYTYMRNFFQDASRPLGVNNRVYKDVGMPHVLIDLQGLMECASGPRETSPNIGFADIFYGDTSGNMRDRLLDPNYLKDPCGIFSQVTEGQLSPDEYDEAVFDLVNFLEYIAEPFSQERKKIGQFVLSFLVILFVPVWFLNREYWKDVH